MLLTVKDLSEQLQIKPATLYAWAAQDKIPCLKIHGVLRFERERINEWLKTFGVTRRIEPVTIGRNVLGQSIEALIARAKASLYTPAREKPDEDRA